MYQCGKTIKMLITPGENGGMLVKLEVTETRD